MKAWTWVRANVSSVSQAGLDTAAGGASSSSGGGSFSEPGILPGVIGLTREGVTAFCLFPHLMTIAQYPRHLVPARGGQAVPEAGPAGHCGVERQGLRGP